MAEYDAEYVHALEEFFNEFSSEVTRLRKELEKTKKAKAVRNQAVNDPVKILPDRSTARTGFIYAEVLGPAVSKRKGGFRSY